MINLEIRDNYDFFIELLNEDKELDADVIYLEQKITNKDWLSNITPVFHSTIEDEINLIVERKRSFYKYGIKLICKTITKEPFFRFDSDGPAHRNRLSNITLSEQIITTPHFNSFNKTGLSIAYKTDTLKQENEAKAITENINFGLSHFFQEANINTEILGRYPEVKLKVPELFDENKETDPLNEVDFII